MRSTDKLLFYPDGARVPAGLRTGEFLLRPLRTGDVELDYAAVVVSKEMLRRWEGGGWPADDFTLAENWKDLERHEQEHLAGEAFTFTMMNLAESECLGCVYVDPLVKILQLGKLAGSAGLHSAGDCEALVRFWVRQPRQADDLDDRLLKSLIDWFQHDWAFDRVFFRANNRDERQVALLQAAGFRPYYRVEVPTIRGPYILYGVLEPASSRPKE